MTNPLFGDARTTMLGQALSGLARRQQALASNIANIDTPGYKRNDVAFESSLRASLGGSGGRLAATNPGHITTGPGGGSLLGTLSGADSTRTRSPRNDGNDVDIDYEMARLAETSLRYDMLVQATGMRLATLKDIVSRIV